MIVYISLVLYHIIQYVVYGPQHCMTMLFCIAESEIKVIHTYIH